MNNTIHPRLVSLFRKEFELCGIELDDLVAVLCDGGSRLDYADASTDALDQIGARAFQVIVTTKPRERLNIDYGLATGIESMEKMAPLVESLGSVKMVVDLTTANQGGLIHDPARPVILGGGARILHLSVEPPDALERCFATEERRARCERAVAMIEASKQMKVTSGAGTNLSVNLTKGKVNRLIGYVDVPGRLDASLGGFVTVYPAPGSVNGVLVLDVGDVNLTFKKYIQDKVRLTLEDDYVVKIEGGMDAGLIRSYIENWGGKDAYGTSHVGFGMNEKARWESLSLYERDATEGQEARAFYGNFMFSIGPNLIAGRPTPSHFDLPMKNCSVFLDGRAVIEHGRVTDEQLTFQD
jgi:2,5-dihydroxypyridine 5,6-dioxygenase